MQLMVELLEMEDDGLFVSFCGLKRGFKSRSGTSHKLRNEIGGLIEKCIQLTMASFQFIRFCTWRF